MKKKDFRKWLKDNDLNVTSFCVKNRMLRQSVENWIGGMPMRWDKVKEMNKIIRSMDDRYTVHHFFETGVGEEILKPLFETSPA